MKKILVIEDDESVALGLSRLLKKHGYEVIGAPDAVSGLERACQLKPDLAVLDISLPGGNGIAVAERIQQLVPQTVHLIFVTGNEDPALEEKALALGTSNFFRKPYDPALLLETISDALAGRQTLIREEVYAI